MQPLANDFGRSFRVLFGFVAWVGFPPLAAQSEPSAECVPLAPRLAAILDSAWNHYRAQRIELAEVTFQRVVARCPDDANAQAGVGYSAMRRGELDRARAAFQRSLEAQPDNYEALSGLGMASYRAGDIPAARRHFTRTAQRFPGDSLTRWYLDRLGESVADRTISPVVRAPRLRVDARAGRRVFEIPVGGAWRPIWLKGVNIGAALPGKHPSEFPPDDGTYREWLELAADMGANTIRVYTIHPPHFYRTLAQWNRAHPARALWLIHGVWTELPPGQLEEQYDDPA